VSGSPTAPRPASPVDTRRRRVVGDDGQAAVELAAALMIAAVLVVVVARIGVVVRDELAVGLAAREGARAAAVSGDPGGAAAAAARRAVALPVSVSTSTGATTVTVTVTYTDRGSPALIAGIIGAVTHRASATMALEPP
jgi:hypothetical protein